VARKEGCLGEQLVVSGVEGTGDLDSVGHNPSFHDAEAIFYNLEG